jgi:hypothetical protein
MAEVMKFLSDGICVAFGQPNVDRPMAALQIRKQTNRGQSSDKKLTTTGQKTDIAADKFFVNQLKKQIRILRLILQG